MRPALGVFLALVVVLAGCTAPLGGGSTTTPEGTTPDDTGTQNGAVTGDETTDDAEPDGDGSGAGGDTTTSGDANGGTTAEGDDGSAYPADPGTDRLGWEAGLWYNESIGVDNSDGMNESERTLAVARAMARIELVRETEFPGNSTVPVDVRSREAFRANQTGGDNYSETFRAFDNVKFEAMLFVDREDSIAVQNTNRGASTAGYYSPAADSMVLITESGLPQFDGERTLAHELVHALQDRKFNLSAVSGDGTRDGYGGYLGLIEGDASYVQQEYIERCEGEWDCIPSPDDSGGGNADDLHFGIYFLEFFPYSDGPGFIRYHLARGGWDRVDAMFEDLPASSEQVMFPEKYGTDEPAEVDLTDDVSNGWERLRPGPQRAGTQRPDYARLGVAALSSMFMYTAYDDANGSALVSPLQFLNTNEDGINTSDPIDYGFDFVRGWEGDRLHAYRDSATGETGYVWRIEWDSPADAEAFENDYARLLSHWGARKAGSETWTIPRNREFGGAFHVSVDDDTVTVVHAPSTDQLGDVYGPAGS